MNAACGVSEMHCSDDADEYGEELEAEVPRTLLKRAHSVESAEEKSFGKKLQKVNETVLEHSPYPSDLFPIWDSNFWWTACSKVLADVFGKLLSSSFECRFSVPCETASVCSDMYFCKTIRQSSWDATSYVSPKMKAIERDLNDVKRLVGSMDPSTWSTLTNYTDIASRLRYSVKKRPDVELGTNAWLKFWTILHEYPIAQNENEYLHSVHLCEAPGAFVSALNHYLSQNYPLIHKQWKWMASSFSPYASPVDSGAIVEDQLIKATTGSWFFGSDGVGDLKAAETRSSIVLEAKRRFGDISLVTADGGIDCSENFAEQELRLADLKVCETLTALRILGPGGCFVLKIFTFFRKKMSLLIAVLCQAFEKVEFYKPATSKPGNSEIYLVCLTYKVSTQEQFSELEELLGENPVQYQVTESFLNILHLAASYFSRRQSDAIKMNLAINEIWNWLHRRLRNGFHHAKLEFSSSYLTKYTISGLRPDARLMRESNQLSDS